MPPGASSRAGARRQAEGAGQAPVHGRGKAGSAAIPRRSVLTFYATRTVRGISLTPHAVLGADVATVTPCTDHRVAAALLATRPVGEVPRQDLPGAVREGEPDRGRASLHPRRATRRRSPGLGAGSPTPPSAAMSRCSPAGPWSACSAPRSGGISPQGTLAEGLADPTFHRGVLAVTLFHLWHERYRDRLAGDDPLDELGLAAARRARWPRGGG